MESKRERFVRIAENRTNKIIDMIDLLGNLSNQSAYEYTQSDVDQIFNAIDTSIKESKRKFQKNDSQRSKVFKLK